MFLQYGLLRRRLPPIVSNIPIVEQAVPIRESKKEVRYNDRAVNARIVGCTSEYLGSSPDRGTVVVSSRIVMETRRTTSRSLAP